MIGAKFGIGALVLQTANLMQTDQLLAVWCFSRCSASLPDA
jgi:hypothetical protein